MSLLLDALKKAAEKKAQKNAENTAVDNTEALTRTQVADDETVADKTAAITQTELDATHIDDSQLDKTAADTTIKIDPTQIDATHIDATQNDAIELSSTELDPAQLDRTTSETTEKAEPTQVNTAEAYRASQKSGEESTQELDIRNLDLAQLAAEENEVHFDSSDETLSFIDEDEIPVLDETEDETLVLTPDDITEFLGDGNYSKKKKSQTVAPQPVVSPPVNEEKSDDTTITNSDSLSLTDIEHDEMELEPLADKGYPVAQDSTRTETASYNSYGSGQSAGRQSRTPSDSDYSDDDEHPTMMDVDGTSSSVDIAKLTNDETVTIKDSTFTRTFAPDNYDRTLMKLADTDVSRIFPGMRSETDSVMTPDYAKKIFITKSRGVKNYYYKVYAGVALCFLLVVVVWGLFQIQSESESIDNNLIALKRDPMPGIIKPKVEPEQVNLFSSDPQVDNKAIRVIEKANTIANEEGTSEVQQPDSTIQTEDQGDTSVQGVSQGEPVNSLQTSTQKSASVKTESTAVKKPPSTQAKQTSLKISSNSHVSEKDQILAAAYAAYEAGDIGKARRLYQQVITLDPENRDALLGRAAIHVFDNQFENAISLYQKLLLANPKDDLAMTSLISVANVDPQAGETQIKRLLNELPDSPYLHFALGNMYGNQNRWSEAQNEYFKALQYKPKDPNYAYNMAISLEHMEKSASAVTFYRRALDNKAYGLATFSEPVVLQRIEVLTQ